MDDVETKHSALADAATRHLTSSSSSLKNCVSVHSCSNPLSTSQLQRFLEDSKKAVKTKRSFNLGVLSGELVVSVNMNHAMLETAHPPPSTSSSFSQKRKRGADDSYDRAKSAVDQARDVFARSGSIAPSVDRHLAYSQNVLERIFRDLRGSNGEMIVESLGLSVAPPEALPNAPSNGRPRVIVACRLSGGIAIPIYLLRSLVGVDGVFFDGLITTKTDSLGPEYRLPLGQLGKEAEAKGQQSALLFVGIPPPPSAAASTASQPAASARSGEDDSDTSKRKAQRTADV